MAKTLQFRRGTTAELSSQTGAVGELFVDTTKDTVVVMDGSTAGGFPLATEAYVGSAISSLVDSAPGALDTLNELAAALGDDANFASTVTNSLSSKQNTLVSGSNIKTINGNSLLGSGDIVISGGGGSSGVSSITAGSGISVSGSTGDITISATGAANTGDFSFNANAISLPDFTDATLNLHGTTTTTVVSSSSVTYTAGQGAWDQEGSQFRWDMSNVYFQEGSNSAFGQQLVGTIPSGTTLTLFSPMWGTRTVTTTSDFSWRDMEMRWQASVDTYNMMTQSFSSISFNVETSEEIVSEQDFTYTFSQTGEFISDSALLGNVLITDNIISALPLVANDAYGTTTEQPLIVNSDLEVLGNVIGDFTVTGLFKSNQSAEGVVNFTTTTSGVNGIPLDFNNGAIFYSNQRSSSFSAIDFKNIPKVAGQVVTVTLILNQGTAYMPTTFYIDGTNIVPKWLGGSAPAGTDSTIDVLSFTIMWVSGTTYIVLASASNYAAA